MNIKQFDEIQPLLTKAHSIILIAMCADDCVHQELDGALWAAKDLISEAMGRLELVVQAGLDSDQPEQKSVLRGQK